MMNRIKERQSNEENLRLLASQRVMYEKAKVAFGWQVLITGGFAILFNFIRLLPKECIDGLIAYILSFSVVATLLDLLLFNKYISKMKSNGAKVQEQFDCNVYQMNWNSFNSGAKADKVIVHNNCKEYVPDAKRPIENWYDINLEGLSNEQAVLLCQETNLWYDGNLREAFKKISLFFLIGVSIISFLISLIMKQDVGTTIVMVIAPLMPGIALTIKIYQENDKSIKSANELRNAIASLRHSHNSPSMDDLRKIQDKIFCSRRDSSLVPEWFYSRRRVKLEEGMKVNASR